MKISKLFHWLYAFVMFLPILALGGTLLINTFNISAKQESEIIYKYETNEVNNQNDLIDGNLYYFEIDDRFISDVGQSGTHFSLTFIKVNELKDYYENVDEAYYDNFTYINDFEFCYLDESYLTLPFILGDGDAYTSFDISQQQNFIIKGYAKYKRVNEENTYLYTLASISDYNEIDHVETHNLNTREVFYNALDDIKVSPYFSWAYNSFLAQPLVYIVTLFNIPANHIVVELLSYWLAISIIWLVFDLIMYVPLLVHRWLDKGVLE